MLSKTENKVLDFFTKNSKIIFLIILTIIAVIIRISFFAFESEDYILFLQPWFEELKAGGGLKALANFPGDYNAPYMTILALLTYLPINSLYSIKIVSALFDVLLAITSAYLVNTLLEKKDQKKRKLLSYITYIAVLFLPQVILNSSYWGQCDAIYTTFSLLAITLLLKEKYTKAFISLGIAFAFKLQFIFILPLFIVLYVIERKFSIINFLIIPLMNFILCIPAMLMGKPVLDCMTIYFRQSQAQSWAMTRNFINIYQIIKVDASYFSRVGILFTLAICAFVLFYLINRKIKWNKEKIVTLGLWFLITITYFLPAMHERYLFVGEVLGIIYYLCYQKNGWIIGIVNLNAIITYASYLFGNTTIDYAMLALLELIALVFFTKNTFSLLNHNTENA